LIQASNPTCGVLRIDNVEHPVSILISNMSGQVLKKIDGIYNEINIDDLPAAVYIVDIRNKAISERFKIVKME